MIRKRIASFAAALILAIQVLPAISLAQSSWTGDSWTGESWQGDSWSQDPYNGAKWSGAPFQYNSWNAEQWQGTDFNGDPFQGNSGNPGQGFQGNPHSGSPFQGGAGSSGSPFQGGSYQGSPFELQGSGGIPGFQGNAFQGNPSTTISPSGGSDENPSGFDIAKLTVNDLLAKNVDMYAGLAHGGTAGDYVTARGAMALSGFKLLTQGNDPAQAIGDVGDIGFKTAETLDAFNQFKQLRLGTAGTEATLLSQAGNASSIASQAAPAISTLAKVNAVTGVVGLGFSSVELYRNVSKASQATGSERTDAVIDSVGNVGDILMSGGAISMAVPGGQALGLGLMAVGGTISIGAAAVRFFRRKSVQSAISTGWNKVTGFLGFGG